MESAANVTGAATLADGLQWTTLQVPLLTISFCEPFNLPVSVNCVKEITA